MKTRCVVLPRSELRTVIVLLCSFTFYAEAQTVSGTVVSATTNKPVPGAIVTAIRTTTPPLSERATTPANGTFQLSNLPAATYRICVQVPAGGYLNPCTWTRNPTTVTLTAGKSAAGVALKLTPGSKVNVFIADPSNVLSQVGKSGQAPPVSMGVRTPLGIIEPFIMRSASKTGSQHEATIPFDSAVPIWIHSAKLALTQVGATAVPASGLSLPVTHPSASAASPPPLQFQITGIKP
jgi:hypothetical protein